MNALIPSEIKNLIYHIRGKAAMLDSDLAALYRVPTGRLNEGAKRNIRRFPEDFMFQLTAEEFKNLMLQIAISSPHGGRRKLPLAFLQSRASPSTAQPACTVKAQAQDGIRKILITWPRRCCGSIWSRET